MADAVFRVSTGHRLQPNEIMTDKLGRAIWAFNFGTVDGVRTTGPEIFVKRAMADGRLSREPVSFSADFFPAYSFSPPETQAQGGY